MRRPALTVTGLAAVTALLGSFLSSPAASSTAPRAGTRPRADLTTAATVPALKVTRLIGGLNLPWDVQPVRDGRLLVTERSSKRLLTWRAGKLRRVAFPASTVWASGETGLMSIAVDTSFTSNRRFYTCQGSNTSSGRHDVRVMAWRLNRAATRATLVKRLLVGLPASTGRHAGCRLLIARNGALIVGTGDAATGTNPQNLASLGGKTLRLNRFTGAPWPANPFISSSTKKTRYVLTYGHRNVQGLALRYDGTLWSVEHGPDRDDEVNLLRTGANYGWNPVPGYNENVPMTDQGLPGEQTEARWSSGFPTLATSGATWITGKQWGVYNGTLAVAALKGSRMLFMKFDSAGQLVSVRTPTALTKFGRLRSISRRANGELNVTTSNGDGHDAVLRVRPVG